MMNERIQELAWESESYADSVVDKGGEFHKAYTEKFAELIILECAKACESATESGTPLHLVSLGYAQRVKEHFGVEE